MEAASSGQRFRNILVFVVVLVYLSNAEAITCTTDVDSVVYRCQTTYSGHSKASLRWIDERGKVLATSQVSYSGPLNVNYQPLVSAPRMPRLTCQLCGVRGGSTCEVIDSCELCLLLNTDAKQRIVRSDDYYKRKSSKTGYGSYIGDGSNIGDVYNKGSGYNIGSSEHGELIRNVSIGVVSGIVFILVVVWVVMKIKCPQKLPKCLRDCKSIRKNIRINGQNNPGEAG